MTALPPPETPPPTVRLSLGGPAVRNATLYADAPTTRGPAPAVEHRPALLVSYVYLEVFKRHRDRYAFRDWALDSGAFSAHQRGTPIDLAAYMACCHELRATDPQLVEIFALDVIGDWQASLRNTERMWANDLPAIPCFHAGEPWDALIHMAQNYPKIALGGVALQKSGRKMGWAHQCFARVHKALGHLIPIHGFGFGSASQLLALPWHSVDATSWELGPCKYGRWCSFGGKMPVRGNAYNLRAEVEWYLRLEDRARVRWRAEMARLVPASVGPTVRLGVVTERANTAITLNADLGDGHE